VLRLDEQRFVYLTVEDTPFLVRSLRWEGEQAIALLSDGSEEPLDAATVRLRPDGAALAQVKGRFKARLASAAWAALADRISERDGAHYLAAAGRSIKLD
jgi:hypothetical protein